MQGAQNAISCSSWRWDYKSKMSSL